MSMRNQLMTAAAVLAEITPEFLVNEVREIIASFELPENQENPAFPTADGQWLSIAEIKAHFGPDYASDHIVIEQVLSVYIGLAIKTAVEEVGLDVGVLNPLQAFALSVVLAPAEQQAFVRMTAN